MRITDLRLIAVVDHAIAIDIDKFQVTRGYRGALQGVRGIPTAILVKIGLYIRLILNRQRDGMMDMYLNRQVIFTAPILL